jgi:hypothetical protein
MKECIICRKLTKNKKFCSKECQYIGFTANNNPSYKGGKKETHCQECHKLISFYPSNQAGKYCSISCCVKNKEWRNKQSKTKIGKMRTEESKMKQSETLKGRKQSKEWIKNKKESIKNFWDKKGRTTQEVLLLKTNKRYIDCRMRVFKRDDYTCQCCGDNKGGNLEMHHIIPFSVIYNEYKIMKDDSGLYDIDNCLTLCIDCHKKTDSYAKHKNCLMENILISNIKILWEQEKTYKTFDDYYRSWMSNLIESLKEKL